MGVEMEQAVVARCQAGDKAAYGVLVQAYSGRIFAICFGLVSNRCDAEDAAQQTLLKGFIEIGALRGSDRFGPWLARIARNLCLDALRRRKCCTTPVPEPGGTDEPRPERFHELEAALAKLSSHYRVPLLLFYFDGRSTENIAQTLGTTQAAVQARLSRGRKELRRLLEAEGDD